MHRERQRVDPDPLIDGLAALYAYVYSVPVESVRVAARERALAMDLSDAWVADGCGLSDPRLREEGAALVRSYAALLAAVHRV